MGRKTKIPSIIDIPEYTNNNNRLIGILKAVIKALESGNSSMTKEDMETITDFISANCVKNTKLTVEETYNYLGISRQTLYNLIKKGVLKVYEYRGGKPYFLRASVERIKYRYYSDRPSTSGIDDRYIDSK